MRLENQGLVTQKVFFLLSGGKNGGEKDETEERVEI